MRSIVPTRVISCGAVLKRHTLPKLVLAQPSHTSQRRREHTQSAHRVSNLCRPWPQPRSSVLRHHSGCKEHASFEFERLRRSPPLPAALQRRLTSSPCCPRPRRSFSPWLTACGRRVSSLGNIRWRWGGLLTLPLHPPALPKNRCRPRSIGSRLAADLHRHVDPMAVRPVTRCCHRVQRPRRRSAQANDLQRSGELTDGRVGRHRSRDGATSHVAKLYVKVLT